MHTLTHPRTRVLTQTLTSYMKVILRNQARAWFNSFHVILSTHNILVSLFPILVMYQIFKATIPNVRVYACHAVI